MTAAGILASSARRRLSESILLAASTAFSVMAIGIFTAAAGSDAVKTAAMQKESLGLLFTSAAIVTVVFAALSGWFFAEHYLGRRKGEIATWLLVGMKRRMAFAILCGEFAIAALLAFLAGSGAGALLSRFFALALQALMSERKPVSLPFDGACVAMGGLACLFQFLVAALRSALAITRVSIADLMKSSRQAEAPPASRPLLAALGSGLLLGSYSAAILSRGPLAIFLMIPVLVCTIAGTFLCFEALVPSLAQALRQRSKRRGAPLLIATAQIAFRSRRNAKLLSLASVLVAVAATASGTVIALRTSDVSVTRRTCPHDLELSTREAGTVAEVETVLRASGLSVPAALLSEQIPGEITLEDGNVFSVHVFSRSAWAAALAALGEDAGPIADGRCRSSIAGVFLATDGRPESIGLRAGGLGASYTCYPEACTQPFSFQVANNALILADGDYARLRAALPPGAAGGIAAWDGLDPVKMRAALPALAAIPGLEPRVRVAILAEQHGMEGAMLFVGIFLAAVFILAAASLLAFRATEDSRDDADRYRIIRELGADRKAIKASLVIQDLFTFGLPLAFGLAHCAAALVMMRSVSGFSSGTPTLIVAAAAIPIFALAASLAVEAQLSRSMATD